jgi:hypothetical protein
VTKKLPQFCKTFRHFIGGTMSRRLQFANERIAHRSSLANTLWSTFRQGFHNCRFLPENRAVTPFFAGRAARRSEELQVARSCSLVDKLSTELCELVFEFPRAPIIYE